MPVRTIKQQEEGGLVIRVFTEQQKDLGLPRLAEEVSEVYQVIGLPQLYVCKEEVSKSEEEFDKLVKC